MTGDRIFIVSAPVIEGDRFLGALITVNKVGSLAENYINPIRIGDTGYALLADRHGKVIVSSEREGSKDEADIAGMNEGVNVLYDKELGKNMITHIKALSNGWRLALTVPEKELLSDLEPLKINSLIGGLVLIGVISLVVFLVIGGVAKVLVVLKEIINSLALGNISSDESNRNTLMKAEKRGDEFSEITRAVANIQEYLEDMSETALEISQKNLDIMPKIRSDGDVLGNAMNTLIDEFSTAFGRVSQTVMQVNRSAEELNAASTSLSHGAAEQAASVEEISASVLTLGDQTRSNAENASAANKLAIEANKVAENGYRQMEKLSEAMNVITTRAEDTQKVIKSIDDIAFQTNLLALNAAVEAARAGVHGKGFAVVAEEVRNLAGRSAKAAGETAELIENMVEEISSGNAIASVTADALQEIVQGNSKSVDLAGEITHASSEQAEGVLQINQGLEQIEKVAQSNTTNAEQTATASEDMANTASMLSGLIAEFKLRAKVCKVEVQKKDGRRRLPITKCLGVES